MGLVRCSKCGIEKTIFAITCEKPICFDCATGTVNQTETNQEGDIMSKYEPVHMIIEFYPSLDNELQTMNALKEVMRKCCLADGLEIIDKETIKRIAAWFADRYGANKT